MQIFAAPKHGLRGALHYEKAGSKKSVAAESKNYGWSVKWAQAAETSPFQTEIQNWKSQLKSDQNPNWKTNNSPKSCGDGEEFDDVVIVGYGSMRAVIWRHNLLIK